MKDYNRKESRRIKYINKRLNKNTPYGLYPAKKKSKKLSIVLCFVIVLLLMHVSYLYDELHILTEIKSAVLDDAVIAVIEPSVTDTPPSPTEAEYAYLVESNSLEPFEPVTYEGDLELPINGATGFASIRMNMTEAADRFSEVVRTLEAGTAFLILQEKDDYWEIIVDGKIGWVQHDFCMINLPDVIPSIQYNITNTYYSRFISSGVDIPGVTGEVLYEGRGYNERLGRVEYIAAIMYSMSKRIYQAQQNALENGDCLLIYESFRPYAVQQKVSKAVSNLAKTNAKVNSGINRSSWSLSWFIATGISNHQRGGAIDVGLIKISDMTEEVSGIYKYKKVSEYEYYKMPSPIHELSAESAVYTYPVQSNSQTAWKTAPITRSMKDSAAALLLQVYCTSAGLTPLASEWWHFNDLYTLDHISDDSKGDYTLSDCYSIPVEELIVED